jgi:citrate lyase subunit beta/citryl-CoA lyase
MRKSLLQAEMTAEFGTCVFDVTLDCEDGAPAGRGRARQAGDRPGAGGGTRSPRRRPVHPVDHPAFGRHGPGRGPRAIACASSIPKESVDDVVHAERTPLRHSRPACPAR